MHRRERTHTVTVVQVKWLVIYYSRLMGIFHNDCIITVGKFWRLGLSTLGPTPELSEKHSGWKLNEKEELIKGLWSNVSVCCVAFFFLSTIVQKLPEWFSWILLARWKMGKGRTQNLIWIEAWIRAAHVQFYEWTDVSNAQNFLDVWN